MNAARAVRLARRRAGLTQRGLAARCGVAQPTIARIERGIDDPRVSTVCRLLAACGESIEAMPEIGVGVDRSEIRRLLRMSPRDRARTLEDDAKFLDSVAQARKRA